ncbi:hypothetical protein SAY86_011327 [Trapa natans]|uniref:Uncharacterized protein n=1 Tax=Trapa natans TaxID=22666 RepID=A0AAN7LLY6_TRANT|nr:hypothetical protein SAY86_011327 [Trapa natans]
MEANSCYLIKPGSFLRSMSTSISNANCQSSDLDASCRNDGEAFTLKFVAMASILVAGMIGILIPLIGKQRRFLQTDGSLFIVAKAFAAGVILATGFVHMLSSGTSAFSDPCLPEYPWRKFPFAGFFAMVAALVTLLIEFAGTQYYQRKQGLTLSTGEQGKVGSVDPSLETALLPADIKEWNGRVFGEEEGGGMHIVGMHAHAAHHAHNHPHGQEACQGNNNREPLHSHGHDHSHEHLHGFRGGDGDSGLRHVIISQVLELGIVSHSVIIGLSLGVSESPCTIRPLIAALSFHQFFEGFALGGCISQAQFKTTSETIMACFFALTTPAGIGVGTVIASSYNLNSPRALLTEGILDCLSAGILVYMALVDLIAADFLSKRMSCNFRLQVVSYVMLFLGAGLMAMLAIWA